MCERELLRYNGASGPDREREREREREKERERDIGRRRVRNVGKENLCCT